MVLNSVYILASMFLEVFGATAFPTKILYYLFQGRTWAQVFLFSASNSTGKPEFKVLCPIGTKRPCALSSRDCFFQCPLPLPLVGPDRSPLSHLCLLLNRATWAMSIHSPRMEEDIPTGKRVSLKEDGRGP